MYCVSGNFTTMSRAAGATAPRRMFELIRICWMARPVQEPMGALVFSLEMTVGLPRRRTVHCLYNDVAFGGISGIMQGISSPLAWRLRESVILCLPMSIPATDKRKSWAGCQSMADHAYLPHILTAEWWILPVWRSWTHKSLNSEYYLALDHLGKASVSHGANHRTGYVRACRLLCSSTGLLCISFFARFCRDMERWKDQHTCKESIGAYWNIAWRKMCNKTYNWRLEIKNCFGRGLNVDFSL